MDATSPALQAKLSLVLIIVFSTGLGIFAMIGFEEWLRGSPTRSLLEGVVALLFLAVAVLHARKVSSLLP